MGMTIAQAASTLGVSEKTIRRRVKNGSLPAQLVGEPPHYEIAPEDLGIVQEESTPPVDVDQGALEYALIETLKAQLQEKDRQIKELHILLQGAQEQTSRMLDAGNGHHRRWWWPFG